MSDDETIPTGKLAQFKYSVSNLWDEFGNTDNLVAGTLINLAIGLPGLAGWLMIDHWISVIGLLWFLVHVVAIVQGFLVHVVAIVQGWIES